MVASPEFPVRFGSIIFATAAFMALSSLHETQVIVNKNFVFDEHPFVVSACYLAHHHDECSCGFGCSWSNHPIPSTNPKQWQ